ncbi:MAG: hypothetical protein AB1486_22785 [Planctomycetota bacterium]
MIELVIAATALLSPAPAVLAPARLEPAVWQGARRGRPPGGFPGEAGGLPPGFEELFRGGQEIPWPPGRGQMPMPGLEQGADLPEIGELAVTGPRGVPPDPSGVLGIDELPTLIRHADTVSVISSQTGGERRLFYWYKQCLLAHGDEVRQGPGGVSEIIYNDNTVVRLLGPNRVRTRLAEDGTRIVEFVEFARAIVEIRDVVTRLRLPGGTTFEATGTEVVLGRRDGRAIEIRNSGPGTLDLYGLPRAAGAMTLPPGYVVFAPDLPVLDRGPVGELHAELLSGLRVVTGEGLEVERTAQGLLLTGEGPGPAVADVGGARVLVAEGVRLHLGRARREPTEETPGGSTAGE